MEATKNSSTWIWAGGIGLVVLLVVLWFAGVFGGGDGDDTVATEPAAELAEPAPAEEAPAEDAEAAPAE